MLHLGSPAASQCLLNRLNRLLHHLILTLTQTARSTSGVCVVSFHTCQPVPTRQLADATVLCRPALHIYSWVHTALRGLVTQQQTLSASLHEFIQAYKQKNLAEVSPDLSISHQQIMPLAVTIQTLGACMCACWDALKTIRVC